LIKKGANIHANEEKALFYASARGKKDVVKLLIDMGANIHALNDDGLKEGHEEIVQILLSKQ